MDPLDCSATRAIETSAGKIADGRRLVAAHAQERAHLHASWCKGEIRAYWLGMYHPVDWDRDKSSKAES